MALKDDIVKWLRDENLEVYEAPVPQGAPVEWALNAVVKTPAGVQLSIVINRPKGEVDKVVMNMVIKVADQHKSLIAAASERDRARFMAQLYNQLVSLCPSCIAVIQPQQDNPTIPDIIAVSRVLYKDNIKPSTVGDSIRLLVNVYFYVVNNLNLEFGGQAAQHQAGTVVHM